MTKAEKRPSAPRRRWLALPTAAAFAAALVVAGGAPAQDLHSKLEQKNSELDQANARAGVLSTTIQQYGDELDRIRGEVAALRSRQAALQIQLEQKEAQLQRVEHRLAVLRARLARSLKVLRKRLVAIYESSQPDTLTVILNAKGFDDLLSRADYLGHVQSQDAEIAARVRNLRNQTQDAVVRVRAARDAIAAQKADLEATQRQLEARQGDLVAARAQHQQVLSRVQASQHRLEGDVSDIQGEIQ